MIKEIDSYQISLKLLLKNSDGEILALKAGRGSIEGYYDFPGGRIDTDEFKTDFANIIAREISEEIGEVKYELNPKPVAVGRHAIPAAMTTRGKDIRILYLFFEAKYLSGEIKISEEHTAIEWVDLNKIDVAKYFTSGFLSGVKMYLGK